MRRAGILPPSYDPLRESLQFRIALAAVDSDGHADWRVAATPEDAALTMNWNAAIKYATNLDAHGHNDWRVLTKNELNAVQ